MRARVVGPGLVKILRVVPAPLTKQRHATGAVTTAVLSGMGDATARKDTGARAVTYVSTECKLRA